MSYAIVAIIIGSLVVIGFWPRLLRRLFPARPIPGQTSALQVDDEQIECVYADGESRILRWADLGSVVIRTTAGGPIESDLFWNLYDRAGTLQLIIPNDFVGTADLLQALQRLPGFDNESVVHASGSTTPADFICWEAPATPAS